MSIDDLCDYMSNVHISENTNRDIINFINSQNIDTMIKNTIIELIAEDSYPSYEYIFNICVENGIELPPLV